MVARADLVAYAVQAANRVGFPADVMVAQIDQESGFDPNAHNDNSGADGIAQFEPATAAALGVDTKDPYSSIDGMATYDAEMLSRFGSVELALAAYDAGPGNVARYGGIPPFTETQRYVANITARAAGEDLGSAAATVAPPDGGGDSGPVSANVSPWLVVGGIALALWAVEG